MEPLASLRSEKVILTNMYGDLIQRSTQPFIHLALTCNSTCDLIRIYCLGLILQCLHTKQYDKIHKASLKKYVYVFQFLVTRLQSGGEDEPNSLS